MKFRFLKEKGAGKGHSTGACMAYVQTHSLIYLLFVHSSIHLLFIYPSVRFIHSSYPYWNPCSMSGIIMLWIKGARHNAAPKSSLLEIPIVAHKHLGFQQLLPSLLQVLFLQPTAANARCRTKMFWVCFPWKGVIFSKHSRTFLSFKFKQIERTFAGSEKLVFQTVIIFELDFQVEPKGITFLEVIC